MDMFEIARIIFALAAVVGMIGLAAIVARKLGLGDGSMNFNRHRRLSLVEVLPLDNRRRAAIIRCDGREHFVILNPNNVTVIERSIPAAEAPAKEEKPAEKPAGEKAPLMKWFNPIAHRAARPQDELTTRLRAAGVL
ncbi:MAG: FliO/MopB family protein [Parvularculaceae bacterium]|nr:FliO/MopB family protein [Parvularculaceae bacterium]